MSLEHPIPTISEQGAFQQIERGSDGRERFWSILINALFAPRSAREIFSVLDEFGILEKRHVAWNQLRRPVEQTSFDRPYFEESLYGLAIRIGRAESLVGEELL